MLEHIVLQFADRAHQAGDHSSWEASGHGGVFGMLGPLVPERVVGLGRQIVSAEWEDAGPIMSTGAADRAIGEGVFDLTEDRRFDAHAAIGIGRCHAGDGEFDQGTDHARSLEYQRRQLRQAAGDGLPQKVVSHLKSRADAALLPLAQRRSRLARSNQPVDSRPYCINESAQAVFWALRP